MGSCLITRNQDGRITEVKTPTEQKSLLFDEVHGNLFLGDSESSAYLTSQAYTPEIEATFKDAKRNVYSTGEPKVFYRSSSNNMFEDIDDMLIADEIGDTTLGFKHPETDEFIPLATFNTEASAKSRFLRDITQQGLLSSKRTLGEDGVTRFKGQGQYDEVSQTSARGVSFELMLELGKGNTRVYPDGTIEFDLDQDYVTAITKNGIEPIRIEDISTENSTFENFAELLTAKKLSTPVRPVTKTSKPTTEKDNEALKQTLLNFLSSMGFEYSTLKDYQERYKTVYGQDPDIKAIADLANKVVAIAEGLNVTEELLEEVSHIAIAAYAEQNSIVGILAEIDSTPEYAEFAESYRAKYSKFYEGVVLEDHIRKEVMGKILAKSIKSNFDTRTKTEVEIDIISKLKNLWDKFVNYISGMYSPYHTRQLDELNNRIAQSILDNQVNKYSKNFVSKDFYYDISDPQAKVLANDLKKAKNSLEVLYKKILQQPLSHATDIAKIMDDMSELEILTSTNAIVANTKKQLENIQSSVKDAKKLGELLNQQDVVTFQALENTIFPLLESITESLQANKDFSLKNLDFKKSIQRLLDEVFLLKASVAGPIKEDYSSLVEELENGLLDSDAGLTEDQKAEIKKHVRTGLKDINSIVTLFGLMSQSPNLYTNMLHARVARMTSDTNVEFKTTVDPIIKRIYEKGLNIYQKVIIKKDKNGDYTNYLKGIIDYDSYDKEYLNQSSKIAAEILNRPQQEILKQLEEGYDVKDLLDTDKNNLEYSERFKKEFSNIYHEQPRDQSYYDERDRKHVDAGIADYTKISLANISQERAVLLRQFVDPATGKIDRSRMKQVHLNQEAELNQRYEAIKNSHDQFGNLKEGLRVVPSGKLTAEDIAQLPVALQQAAKDKKFKGNVILPVLGLDVNNLEEQARISFDTQNLNLLYFTQDKAKGEVSDDFKNKIKELEDAGDHEGAVKFALMNATLTLNDKFYGDSDSSDSYISQLEKFVGNNPKYQDSFKEYQELQFAKTSLLKQNRSKKNPLEIDAYNMSTGTKTKLLSIERRMEDIKKDLKNTDFEYNLPAESKSIKTINEALEKELLQHHGATAKVEFMREHMTPKKRTNVDEFNLAADKLLVTKEIKKVKKSFQAFIDRMTTEGKITPELKDKFNNGSTQQIRENAADELANILKLEYAKQNVASYYTKFEPAGYSKLMQDLKSGTIKVSDLVDNKASLEEANPVLKYLDFNPDFSWLNEISETSTINPLFNKEGLYRQPKLSKFVDKEFFSNFGIDYAAWEKSPEFDLNNLTANANTDEFELLKEMINIRSQVADSYGDKGKLNPYLRPQISKNTAEVVLTGSLKSSWKDLIHNRIDDKEQGEVIGQDNAIDLGISIIPKYYQTKLRTGINDLTESTLTASLMDLQQSILYKNRVKATKDLHALEWAIKNQEFNSSGKLGTKIKKRSKDENSNYYKQAKEYVNHHLYGVKQTRNMVVEFGGKEVNVTRVINVVQGFFRFSNLAFNPFIDITSATTGVFNNAMDRATQAYYHPSSANRGNSLALAQCKDYFFESGKMNKESVANHITEYLGLQDMDSKIKNSAFSRGTKFFTESAYKMSKAANIPVGLKLCNTILSDYRYVTKEDGTGQFMNWENYYAYKKNINKSTPKSIIESGFNVFKGDSLYDNITVDKNGLRFNDKFLVKYNTDTALAQTAFDNLRNLVSLRARSMAQQADGTLNELDQVAAQRDVVTNTLLLHRGWLPIILSKAFKSKHYSASMGRYEEGHFLTTFKFLTSVTKSLKSGESVKDIFKDLPTTEQKNIKRTFAEVAALFGVTLLGFAIFGDDDDDDHSYLYNVAKYITLRTRSEIATQTPFGLTGAVIDVMKSPFTSIRLVEAIEPTSLLRDIALLDGNAFLDKFQKNTLLKRYDQFTDLDKKITSYQHFNASTLGLLSPENEKDWKEAYGDE